MQSLRWNKRDDRGAMKMQDLFIPFTINRQFWDREMPNVFLNQVYEAQIEEGENYPYTTLLTAYSDSERLQKFWLHLTHALGNMLNRYHGLDESTEFWEKLLSSWVRDYVYSIWFKIEQFKNLMAHYPLDTYSFHTCAFQNWEEYDLLPFDDGYNGFVFHEQYHFISYLWLAKKFFHVQVAEVSSDTIESPPDVTDGRTVTSQLIMSRCKAKIKKLLFEMVHSSRMEIGVFEAQQGKNSWKKWLLWSKGKICPMEVPKAAQSEKTDTVFRGSMAERLVEELGTSEEERMILDFLPKVLPKFFVEDFMASYAVAENYLSHHPNLSVIFTSTSSLKHNAGKIIMVLLQKRGGRVLGQQHGGMGQITDCLWYFYDRPMEDYLYLWGKDGRLEFGYPSCKITYAPSYLLALYDVYGGRKTGSFPGQILYVGTAVRPYPRALSLINTYEKKRDDQNMAYISRKMQFLSALTNDVRSKCIVRDYPIDYGWHVAKKLQTIFPNLRISTEGEFRECLEGCLLYVVDHLSTTWLEALYINKPMIIFMSKEFYPFYSILPDEQPYFDMLEEVGILFYSPEAAAAQVNRILNEGVTEWWMNAERQNIVQQLRNRWASREDDIDAWWFDELSRQGKAARA